VTDAECLDLLRFALPRLGLRWEGFRRMRGQVCKRIARRLAALGLPDAAAYRAFLLAHPEEWGALDGLCRVTVSRFFRDRAVWEWLRAEGLPALARLARDRGEGAIRCWSAGCGSGEEPYGLSIVWRIGLAPAFPGLTLRVLATDADEEVLARARRACYAPASLRELPLEWTPVAFERSGAELCLRAAFREGVELVRADVRRDLPAGPFHGILCRNLAFTYLDLDGQMRVLSGIVARLAPGGLLVVGGHERLPAGAGGLERCAGPLPVYRRSGAGCGGRSGAGAILGAGAGAGAGVGR
jgi:chemotaxis protein methyltransferase CheR